MQHFSLFVERNLSSTAGNSQIEKLGVVTEILLDLVRSAVQLLGCKTGGVSDVVSPPAVVVQPLAVRYVAGVEENQEYRKQ